MTSNVLTDEMLHRAGPGFASPTGPADPRTRLAEHFAPELLGRIDEVLVFRQLDVQVLRQILQVQMDHARERLVAKGVQIDADATRLLDYLLQQMDPHSGARGIARAIERGLLQPLARALLLADPSQPMRVVLDEDFYRDGRVSLCPA